MVAAATNNGTWFVSDGHLDIWADDFSRYTGGSGTGLINWIVMIFLALMDALKIILLR